MGFPLGALDSRFSYAPREVGALFWSLGDSGRARYLLVTKLDLIFIGVYFFFFVSLAQFWAKSWVGLSLTCAFAALMALCDLGETLGTRYLLEIFPAADNPMELFVSRCTPLKWYAFAGVALSLFGLWWRRWERTKAAGAG